MICDTLRLSGYAPFEAADGFLALKWLRENSVDLIISDINMPNMDGITFLKEMKTKANYKFTPVIMLTTEGAEEKKREGQAAGAKAWIVKPFRPEQMLQAVSMLI